MSKKKKDILNLTILFTFLFFTLFINFFHTERHLTDNDNCPACNFQISTFTTHQIIFFILPHPDILGILKTYLSFNYHYIFVIEPSSRSPPQILPL